jgi:hypothetical protein
VDLGGDAHTDVWLAGIWLPGGVEASLTRGRLDVRWCTLGGPGTRGLHLAGGGHEHASTRFSLPESTLEVRLVGCELGTVDIPPWVSLVAHGCTFDAGDRDAPAIVAPGARVRLRHCTVHGGIVSGALHADSTAVTGPVRVDRPDLGWARHCALSGAGQVPQLYRCWIGFISYDAVNPGDPRYLRLSSALAPSVLRAGEAGTSPGAIHDHGARLEALRQSTAGAVPLGLEVVHQDRTTLELARMSESGRRFL